MGLVGTILVGIMSVLWVLFWIKAGFATIALAALALVEEGGHKCSILLFAVFVLCVEIAAVLAPFYYFC